MATTVRLQRVITIEDTDYTYNELVSMDMPSFKMLVSFVESEKDLQKLHSYLDQQADCEAKASYLWNLLESVRRVAA